MNFSKNESLGKITAYKKEKRSLQLKSDNANISIYHYDDQIVRIKIFREMQYDDFSYAVIAKNNLFNFPVEESGSKLVINFKKFKLHISKNKARFKFVDNKKEVINEDEKAFGTSWIGNEVYTYKKLQENEKFVGLGEKTTDLNLRGKAFTNWNTDSFAYGEGTDPIYAGFPFYIGINNGKYYGIFFDNTHRTNFNFGASNNRFVSFSASDGIMDYYFIYGNSITEILTGYSNLTGKMPLPPVWSLGLQQCRYSYYPEHELYSLADNYRNRKIPCDVLYYDIHYMQDYKVFSWDKERFPDPKKLNSELKKRGFRTVVILDPGIKKQKGYEPYDSAKKSDLFVKYADGRNYEAEVWPGNCHFPDFTDPDTRAWWSGYFKQLNKEAVSGFWNDMNEPASWGQNTPDNLVFNYDGYTASHKAARNIYGMQMSRATYEGALKAGGKNRPFVLTRASYCGGQRYAAVWTGDNTASDEHLLMGARMVNSLGLTGIPFAGYDVGGFIGETSADLFTRWLQMAAFAPFFRIHKMINSKDSEPWTYGEKAEAISKNFIELRYRLMPHIYNIFYQAALHGLPVNRSLAIYFPDDEKIYQNEYQNQFLLGDSILVCPQTSNTNIAKVYLPKGNWYDLYNDKYYKGNQELLMDCPIEIIPLFVKAGAIIPEQSVVQFWNDKNDGILRLHIYESKADSHYLYMEDDGISSDFDNRSFYIRKIEYIAGSRKIILNKKEGNYKSKFSKLAIYFHSKTKSNSGKSYRFIEPLPNYDPFINNETFKFEIDNIASKTVNLKDARMEIKL